MLTTEQVNNVKDQLTKGVLPETIASQMGIPYSTFRIRLSQSGYRIRIQRELEQITPVMLEAKREAVVS